MVGLYLSPAVPLKIEEGGAWTLQRLNLETHPFLHSPIAFAGVENADSVQVLQQVKIEALNITVLRGSGQAVLDWASSNGFSVNGDTRSHLLIYAKGSPIFMAAKFDTAAARARHQIQGDGAPILITMRTAHLWVPLEVLALDGQQVQADIYLMTDGPVNTSDVGALVGQSPVGSQIPGATGFTVAFQEKMNPTLFHDLSTDRNMGWVWQNSWITYLNLDAPDTTVTYDLGISSNGVIRLAHFGTPPMAVTDSLTTQALPFWLPQMPIGTPQVLLGDCDWKWLVSGFSDQGTIENDWVITKAPHPRATARVPSTHPLYPRPYKDYEEGILAIDIFAPLILSYH